MKIYTYHSSIGRDQESLPLLNLWRQRWLANGWTPEILSEREARKHPDFAALATDLAALPTVNAPGYELACYLRWLAMAVVGGGWMSDADVMPYGFFPQTPEQRLTVWSGGACPCLVSGSASEYDRMARRFAAWQPTERCRHNGHLHCSDQNILDQLPAEEFERRKLVEEFSTPGWESALAVHYPNARMRGKQPRHEWIPRLRSAL